MVLLLCMHTLWLQNICIAMKDIISPYKFSVDDKERL